MSSAISTDDGGPMAVISIASSFGAGASVVARHVGTQLGWQVVNRAIPVEVAQRLSRPLEEALAHDERIESGLGSLFSRWAIWLAPMAGGELPPEALAREDIFKAQTEEVIRGLAERSNAVVVGRAAAFVLGDRPDALHVRLDGPLEARVRQAMAALGMSEDEARNALWQTDRARSLYVRHFYHHDWADPSVYHLIINSTALPLDTCAKLVLEAAETRFRASPQSH
jgi:cytidylate kinase